MESKFSQKMQNILKYSKEEAIRLGNDYIGVEHLFLGILRDGEGTAIDILRSFSIDLLDLKKTIEKTIRTDEIISQEKDIPLVKQTEKCLKRIYLEFIIFKSDFIGTEHLLLSILRDEDNIVTSIISKKGCNYQMVADELKSMTNTPSESNLPEASTNNEDWNTNDEDDETTVEPIKRTKIVDIKSKTPVLDNFGKDLTLLAEENKLDPVVGREKELERISQILSRRKKNNPILIGEPGVGKSAIAEGLALRIVNQQVSRVLFNKRVISLDVASLVAGTKYRGQFEERMKALLNELEKNPDIIIFIDEIHTIVGAGSSTGSLDASNMFKPALARGEIQCIGATTLDEYRQNIEKDGALERRFQKVIVEPTTEIETIEILNNIKEKYENHHSVKYTEEAIKACVFLTQRYISDRCLPDKAIDALDESGSRVHISNIKVPKKIVALENEIEKIKQKKLEVIKLQKYEEAAVYQEKTLTLQDKLVAEKQKWDKYLFENRDVVDEQNVAEVVAMMSGVPTKRIAKNEGNKLLNMENDLRDSVIGQDEAIKKVTRAIRRNRAGLKDPNKPIGSFIFVGPTGVGKTHLAKVLSKYLFDSDDAIIRIDMSEYMEKFAVSRLIGAPPGYVGYEEGGQLSEKVRRKPYSVILLDEIEKAHPDIFHILLQVLDDGILTDSYGRKIDFKNTIIIMTSNIGSRQLKDFGTGVGFATASKQMSKNSDARKIIDNSLKKVFAPEFLNRVDDIVMFDHLEKTDIHKIIDIELKGLFKRILELGFKLSISTKAKDFLATKGWDSQFGARPLKRAIQTYLEDELAEEIIGEKIAKGDTISVDTDAKNENIKITIKKQKAKI